LNINIDGDDEQMQVRGLPLQGNKRESNKLEPTLEGEDEVRSYITDADLVKSDFEEYRGLGVPSIDSWTMNKIHTDDVEKISDLEAVVNNDKSMTLE
jgi:hypothetical protein